MNDDPDTKLFRAWRQVRPPPFDVERGRARLLAATLRPKRTMGRTVVVLLAASFALFFAVWQATPKAALQFTTDASDGHAGEWLATPHASDMTLTFSEGTKVVLAADSRGRVEQLGPSGATFLLERGEVRAHVTHSGHASWRFRGGPFEVEVTGTTLAVQWEPALEQFSVRVDEGSVVVHGPNPGALQIVRAGERYHVDLPSSTLQMSSAEDAGPRSAEPPTNPEAAPSASRPVASVPHPAPSSPPRRAMTSDWLDLEERGDYDSAHAAATKAGVATLLRSSSADELLRLATVEQLSGHRDTQRDALLACRGRFAGTERAAVAAYELGRGAPPKEAAVWFDTYLREAPRGELAREALGRLVEARIDSGDVTAGRLAARSYVERYPTGPQAALARRVLGGAAD